MMKAIYPGSFDPITLGHIDIITRASKLFDEVVVLVAHNTDKSPLFTADERVALIRKSCEHLKNITIQHTDELTVEFAKKHSAHVMLRSVRNSNDMEFELQLAFMNQQLSADIETIFLLSKPEFVNVSSSLIKEIVKADGDIKPFLPEPVARAIKQKLQG